MLRKSQLVLQSAFRAHLGLRISISTKKSGVRRDIYRIMQELQARLSISTTRWLSKFGWIEINFFQIDGSLVYKAIFIIFKRTELP